MSPCEQRTAVTALQLGDEGPQLGLGGALHQLGALLDGNPQGGGQRLDRLPAADVRAREDALDAVARVERRERRGLAHPALVERAEVVVIVARPPVAGRAVAEEEQGHQAAPSA